MHDEATLRRLRHCVAICEVKANFQFAFPEKFVNKERPYRKSVAIRIVKGVDSYRFVRTLISEGNAMTKEAEICNR